MALTLHVQRDAWRAMVDDVFAAFPGLVPVVKGNGYGFGRIWLAEQALAHGARRLAVGTVFELAGLDVARAEYTVLTPSLDLDTVTVPPSVVLTVASEPQLDHLLTHRPVGPVTVKVETSMRRHGFGIGSVAAAVEQLRAAGTEVRSLSIHPGLVGSDDDRLAEISGLLSRLPADLEVSVSHLGAHHYSVLRSEHAERTLCIRLGSALWHGDKRSLSLTATVLDTRRVHAGEQVGYRGAVVPGAGTMVIVGAGSAHGVQPLANGDSPFHFARRRLTLLESPHMHVSVVWVPEGETVPRPGDDVDVQRPLITTAADRVEWF